MKNPAAIALGHRGGLSKSSVKAEAVRVNGKLGGRPRLPRCEACGEKLRDGHACVDDMVEQLSKVLGG